MTPFPATAHRTGHADRPHPALGLERNLMKSRLLEAFGWGILAVLSKDWYEARQEVLEQILKRLEEAPNP